MSEQKKFTHFLGFGTSGLLMNRWFLVFLFDCRYTFVSAGPGMKGGVCV